MTTLSGRVDNLEQNVTFITQDLLRRISIDQLSDYNVVLNQTFDSLEDKWSSAEEQISILQVLYTNLVLSGRSSGSSGLSETFETISKNLKQYNYSLSYQSGYLTGIYYPISNTTYVSKKLSYNESGLLTQVELSGYPIPTTSLRKVFLYSGETLTGVNYS